jgi:hypothetical protein
MGLLQGLTTIWRQPTILAELQTLDAICKTANVTVPCSTSSLRRTADTALKVILPIELHM